MRVSCLQENLARGLAVVGRAVATRSTLPQTTHVLLRTDAGRLRLAATNLEIAITCWVGAQVDEEGAITVPARLFSEFVNSLPNERIDLAIAPKARQLHIACGRNEATISGADPSDFPPIPEVAQGPAARLDPEALRTAIAQVEFAAATDDTRPVLTGVHTLLEEGVLTLAAADGFRLAVHRLTVEEAPPERIEVIVPARAMRELQRLLADEREPVLFTVNEARSQALFRLHNVEMVAQLVQGTFPNYGQLIPQEHRTRAVLDLKEFLQETRRAAIFARDGSNIVRLHIEPSEGATAGRLVVWARAEELGEHRGELDALVEGEPAKIAFNAKYLQDVLQVLECSQVALETTTPTSPGVFRPVGLENYVHVVMPMFVQW
jgi:DNA polymerase-3 subunit beta